MVAAGDAGWGNFIAAGFHQLGCRSAECRMADQGTDRDHLSPRTTQCVSNLMNRENRSHTGDGITGSNDDKLRLSNGVQDSSGSAGLASAQVRDGANIRLPMLTDEKLLKTQDAIRRFNSGSNRVVGGGKGGR